MFPASDMASLVHFLCVVFVAAVVSSFFYQYVEKTGVMLGKQLIEKLER